MLDVKNTAKNSGLPEKPANATARPQSGAVPAWPNSLYATPRVPVWSGAQKETFVAEDIMDACRSAVQQLDLENLTSIGITSSIRGEGRTTIALATALVLAEYGLGVVLMELDLAHPELANRLGVAKTPGVGDLAEGRAALSDTMHSLAPGLTVIPAGQFHGSIPRAIRELASNGVIDELASQGRVVVADLPPLTGNGVGRQAVALVTEPILVVRAGVVVASNIKEAVAGLSVTPKVFLNGTHSKVPAWALRLSGI
jgi:Mrp family chromosome partitioning ATPase